MLFKILLLGGYKIQIREEGMFAFFYMHGQMGMKVISTSKKSKIVNCGSHYLILDPLVARLEGRSFHIRSLSRGQLEGRII